MPYWYIVSDGAVDSLIPVIGAGATVGVSETNDLIAVRAVDRFGLSVGAAPVTFSAVSGGGALGKQSDAATDALGIAASFVNVGSNLGDQVFRGNHKRQEAGLLFHRIQLPGDIRQRHRQRRQFPISRRLAPGSYLTIAGTNLSAATSGLRTNYLPVSLAGTSVSFDSGSISVPGRLSYVSPTQINVQIPWELQGQTTAVVKVNFEGLASFTSALQIAPTSPAFFEIH